MPCVFVLTPTAPAQSLLIDPLLRENDNIFTQVDPENAHNEFWRILVCKVSTELDVLDQQPLCAPGLTAS